jgi:molybdopterin converting factor small subunit
MRVTVEYFGPAREAAGVSREPVDCNPSHTAFELVARIASERGGRLASLLLRDGRLSPSIVLAVNDQQVSVGDSAYLQNGDVISVIPPVSGGLLT